MNQRANRAGTLANIVHRADIFNGPIYLNIKGRQTIATMLGGLLSIVLVLLLLAQGIILLVEMLDRTNPTIIQISEFQDPPAVVPLNYNRENAFSFGFSTTVNGVAIDMTKESLFLVSASFNVYNWTNNDPSQKRTKTLNTISFAPCDHSTSFQNLSPEVFNQNGMNVSFCPVSVLDYLTGDPYPPEFAIAGSYLNSNFQFIQFNVTLCPDPGYPASNTTSNATLAGPMVCTTNHTFYNDSVNYSQLKFNLYYTNSLVTPGQYNPPIQPFLDSIYWDIDPNFYQTTDIYIDQGTIQNYDSIYSSSNNTNQTYYSFNPGNNREQMVTLNPNVSNSVLQWNIRRSNFNLVTIRTYTKIQDILANIGGLSRSIMFIFAFIAIGYVRYKYQTMLSNELYNYEIPGDQNQRGEDPSEPADLENRSSSNLNKKVQDQLGGSSEDADSLEDEEIRGYFTKEKKTQVKLRHSEFGYFAYLLSSICCCCPRLKNKPEERIAKKARTYVEHDIDIVDIIHKLKDVEKLKMVFFTQDQREIFDSITKPVIKEESQNPIARDVSVPYEYNFPETEEFMKDGATSQQDHVMVIKYMKLYYSYRHISSEPQLSQTMTNKRLLVLMGEDLIKVFDKIHKEVGGNPDARHLYNALWKYIETEKKNK